MAASVPVYLTGSPASQLGGLPATKAPQSTTLTLSFADSGLALSLSVIVPRVSVKAPERVPELPMSTWPVRAGSPGRMSVAVNSAEPASELYIASVPVAKDVDGLADEAVKSAPDAAVMPTATRTVAS